MVKTLALFVVSLLAAFWLGGSDNFLDALAWNVVLAVFAAIATLFIRVRGIQRLAYASIALILVFLGHYLGRTEAARAYNDCVARAEEVRLAVVAFHSKTKQIPATMEETGVTACGQKVLRPALLSYRTMSNDFELSFSDSLITWKGSISEPMMAHK